MGKTEVWTVSGIDEQPKLCGCFDREDIGYYWRIRGESGTLGYINNKMFVERWSGKTLTVYGERTGGGIYSFVSMIRRFICSRCNAIHRQHTPEFRELVRMVYAIFKEDGWGVEGHS